MNKEYVYTVIALTFNEDESFDSFDAKTFKDEDDAKKFSDGYILDNSTYKIKEINDLKMELADADGNKRVVVKVIENELI